MKAETLNKKCPKCGCEDKHIFKNSGTVGVVGGPQHKSSTGFRSKEGNTDVQTVDTYLWKNELLKNSYFL